MEDKKEQSEICSDDLPCIECRVSSLETKMRVIGFAVLIAGLCLAYMKASSYHGK